MFTRKKSPKGKDMTENKETIEEHRENEEVTPISDPVSPPIDPTVPDPEVVSGEKAPEILKAELAEMNDKFLRLYSEFDNYRRRTQKERLEMLKTAGSDVIISLLPILDDFERALKFKSPSATGADSGMELIYNKLKSILESRGLKRMKSVGEEFDVDLHDAITNVPAPSEELKGKVIEEAECGYFLNDKVIRHAKVIVGA
jgi:molecular chaperone GrpE